MATSPFGRFRGPARSNNWPDWVNLILAIWLFISPWVLQFAVGYQPAGTAATPPAGGGPMLGNAAWNAWVLGVIIALVAISALSQLALWQEWLNLLLGIWVFIAPWVLGFSGTPAPAWDHWIVGFLVFVFSLANLAMLRRTPAQAGLAHAGDKPGDPH